MRYLEVSVFQSPDERNPMHQFVVEHETYGTTRLLARDRYAATEHALLFHVEGPPEPYVDELANRDSIIEFAYSGCADDTSYVYVSEDMPGEDQAFASAFGQPGLLILVPVEYRPDGTVVVTAVGPAAAVQAAVETVPDSMGVDVLAVGEFTTGRIDARLALTQRQFEAVQAAVEIGYYRSPREATLADLADRLDCSTGTAGDLLRRAERTVMAQVVAGGPF